MIPMNLDQRKFCSFFNPTRIWIKVSFARFSTQLLFLVFQPNYLLLFCWSRFHHILKSPLCQELLSLDLFWVETIDIYQTNVPPTLMSSDSGISGTPKSISLQTPKTKCSKMMTKRSLRAKIYLVDVATRFSLIYLIWVVLKIEKGNFCKPVDRSEISLVVTESSATKKLVLCCFYLECTMFW